MKCKKIFLGIISMALIAAILVFCFHYDGGHEIMTEGTLVSSSLSI